ncbi:hypothetical protein Pd630_LPD03021 [Rhodococcus opacus PD630]|nr:hypothetical protein Pd630_LPD03021 [Rhodococcus opacus PD630]
MSSSESILPLPQRRNRRFRRGAAGTVDQVRAHYRWEPLIGS